VSDLSAKQKWGPYLSERQWGTVREDYSADGDAWKYFPHAHARSRTYRWGEDGIAGWSDDQQRLCLSLALWNGKDEILKERLFGLANEQGNHGEDVKELYYYLDATPDHSYLKMLYKYPQAAFPYQQLVEENHQRSRLQPEYEILDTGVFDQDRYFDVFVEYAQESANDTLMLITICNRGDIAARIHVLPQLCLRNTWSWTHDAYRPDMSHSDQAAVEVHHSTLGMYYLYADSTTCSYQRLFTDNESNNHKLWKTNNMTPHVKDAFHEYIVNGDRDAINPEQTGTKAAIWYQCIVPAKSEVQFRLRLARHEQPDAFGQFDAIMQRQRDAADNYYNDIQRGMQDVQHRLVHRQACAGLIWNKQFYYLDLPVWLKGDETQVAPPPDRAHDRNAEWLHFNSADILSMPDKWEYPWFAAWDLAFHCIPFALIDATFAKRQLLLLTREWYMHPNGQLPAYEWNFSDSNPPLHAWAAWRVFQIDRKQRADKGDLDFLERVFHKLMINFTWWVNKRDINGRNIFQGGFLGLDNISAIERNMTLPDGCYINQADGTAWMAMYALNLLRIALELALHDKVYEDIATKFFEHFMQIAEAMERRINDGNGLWDEEDGFFYDVLKLPDRESVSIKLHSIVGIIPLFAAETLEPEMLSQLPGFSSRLRWYLNHRSSMASLVTYGFTPGRGERRLLSLLRGSRLKRLLQYLFDENEFLSPFGIRSLSKIHADHPFHLQFNGQQYDVHYTAGEGDSPQLGGNSNWRGPIWLPMNFLIIEALQRLHHYFGDSFKIAFPTGSSNMLTLDEIATDLSNRLIKLFVKEDDNTRPIYENRPDLQNDPYFCNYIQFHEYFHGDNGKGLGASHQTGWTALIAKLLMPREKAPD